MINRGIAHPRTHQALKRIADTPPAIRYAPISIIEPGAARPPVVSRSTTTKRASSSGTRSDALRAATTRPFRVERKFGSSPRTRSIRRAPSSGSEPTPLKSRPINSPSSAPAGRARRNAWSFSLVLACGRRRNSDANITVRSARRSAPSSTPCTASSSRTMSIPAPLPSSSSFRLSRPMVRRNAGRIVHPLALPPRKP